MYMTTTEHAAEPQAASPRGTTCGAKILGIGAAIPPGILTNKDFEAIVDTSDEWIVSRTGIRERHVAPKEVLSSDLAAEAARNVFARTGVQPHDIDAMVLATATPDTAFPSTACWAQAKLGLRHVPCFDIIAGCSGFLYALNMANALVTSGTANTVLVVGVDELTRITNYTDRNTCVLFGDGAGAVVVTKPDGDGRGILSTAWGADGSLGELLLQPAGGTRMPASAETVANHLHTIHMAGNEVFRYAVKAMQQVAFEALEKAGVDGSDIDLFVPHQANQRIITATADRAGIPMDKVVSTIDRYGNNSAASIPMALDYAYSQGRLREGMLVLTAAFGSGFTWASALFRW